MIPESEIEITRDKDTYSVVIRHPRSGRSSDVTIPVTDRVAAVELKRDLADIIAAWEREHGGQ